MVRIAKKAGAYHHGNLRRVLLDATVKLIEKDGVSAVSLHALTRRTGVSSGAPYHHFTSREQLLATVAAEGFELLVAEMQQSVAGTEADPVAYLEGLGRAYVRFAINHRGHFRVMFRAELADQLPADEQRPGDEAFGLLERAILRCQDAGKLPAGDARPFVLLAWSLVHGASDLWIDGSLTKVGLVPDGTDLADAVASTLVRLLTGQLRP